MTIKERDKLNEMIELYRGAVESRTVVYFAPNSSESEKEVTLLLMNKAKSKLLDYIMKTDNQTFYRGKNSKEKE